MGKRIVLGVLAAALFIMLPVMAVAQSGLPVKIAVFNLRSTSVETSIQATSVTNMLMGALKQEPTLNVMDRRELEAFLALNDLQQNDELGNILDIGTRLALGAIVVGSVEKVGPVIIVNCRVISISQKRVIFSTQLKSFGDEALVTEIPRLSKLAAEAILSQLAVKEEAAPTIASPMNIQCRSGSRKITLRWEDPPGSSAVAYEVFRATVRDGPFAAVAQTGAPEYVDQNVERNVTYFYKVRSVDGRGVRSKLSDVISATTALTPNPPVILSAEGCIKSVQLTWSPNPMPSEDPLKLIGYKLYRATAEGGPYHEVANLRRKEAPSTGMETGSAISRLLKVTYTDTGLDEGCEYFYRVTAYNERGLESDYSCPFKVQTVPPVGGLTAEGDMLREVALSWDHLAVPAVKGYVVWRSPGEPTNFTRIKWIDAAAVQGGKVYFTDKEGLADNTRYYYRVTAVGDGDIETSPSVVVSAVTKGKPVPPVGFTAKSGLAKQVELSWTPSTDKDVVGYTIFSGTREEGPYELLARINDRQTGSFTDERRGGERLADGSRYFYVIRAVNRVGLASDNSPVAAATTKQRPTPPEGLQAQSLRIKEVPLRWKANPEADIVAYYLYRRLAAGGDDFARVATIRGKTEYTDTALRDGTFYQYRLVAEDKDGLQSDFSAVVEAQTRSKPKSPEKLRGSFHNATVELTWEAPADPDIVGYVVYEKRRFSLVKLGLVKETRYRGAGPAKGEARTYFVTSVDKDGLESEPSMEVTGKGS